MGKQMAMRGWAMKPSFTLLKAHHMGRGYLPPQVYDAIGHPELALNPAWGNTCAVRMSVALVWAGIKIRTGPARLRLNAGPLKGEQLEPSQHTLSEFLAHEIGKPERYRSGPDAHNTIGWRHGIVAFFSLHGSSQGHIDLASVSDWPVYQCSLSCYWDCREVWFWDLT
jgi:hypothetical protein